MWSTNESQGKMALPAETKPAVAASSQAITAQATTTPAPKAPAVDAKPNTPQGDAWWTPKK
jgi:hypothetical protein